MTLVVFGDVFCPLEGITNIDGEGSVGKTRRIFFEQMDSTRAGQLGEIKMLAFDDDVLAVKRNRRGRSRREDEYSG